MQKRPEAPDPIPTLYPCRIPPVGWVCTRGKGHDGPCAAVAVDVPIAGPRMHWNADGLHIEDPRLADQPERVGGMKGCWTITWEDIREKHARFAPETLSLP